MDKNKQKRLGKALRKARVRSRVFGTEKKPRLSVFRSLKQISVQVIDDNLGKTLVSASSLELKSKAKKLEKAYEVGKLLAKKAGEKKISEVVFDRGSFRYHGRVKSLADGAREGGLKF